MFGIGQGFLKFLRPFYDDEGGGGNVTELPPVPSPSSDDIDALSGDDDDDDAGDDKDDDDRSVNDDDDDSSSDENDDEEEEAEDDKNEKPSKKKKEKDEVINENDDDKDDDKEKDDKEVKGDDKKVPSIKALKTAYPDIFKKFPHVRTAIAEHQQFRAIYSSVDEAREAADTQESFNTISERLMDHGDFGYIIDEIQKNDPAAAARLMKKVLPAIAERSRDLYMDITELPIAQFVHAAFRRGGADGNKNLQNAALHLWKFLGKDGTPSAPAAQEDPKDKEFQEKVKSFETKKFNDAVTSVNSQISTDLKSLIEQAIDPKDTLKETTKKALVNELTRQIDQDIAGDRNHMTRVERLWANARRSSYAQGHLSRIISAYLERAKQVLPKHARKVREENNIPDDKGGKKDERRPNNQENNRPAPRPHAQGNPPRHKTIRDTSPRDIDWNKTSDEDVLGGRATLKRR